MEDKSSRLRSILNNVAGKMKDAVLLRKERRGGFFFKVQKKKKNKDKKKLRLLNLTRSKRVDTTKLVHFYQKLFSTDIYKRRFTLYVLAKHSFAGLEFITTHKRGPLKKGRRIFMISKVKYIFIFPRFKSSSASTMKKKDI